MVELAATWWLQSTILLAIGLATSAWLRGRGAALQSVVYRVTLGAVLLCPLATYLLANSGVSLTTLDLRSLSLASESAEPSVVSVSVPAVADDLGPLELVDTRPRSGDHGYITKKAR